MNLNIIPVITNRSTLDIIVVPDIYYWPEILNLESINAHPPCKYAAIKVKNATNLWILTYVSYFIPVKKIKIEFLVDKRNVIPNKIDAILPYFIKSSYLYPQYTKYTVRVHAINKNR